MANEPVKQYITSINGYTIQDQELTDTVDTLKTTVSTIKDWTNEKIAALTKDDIGLDKVDNTADADKSVKVAVQDTDGDKFTEKYIKVRGDITDFDAATVEGIYTYSGITTNGYRGSVKCYGTLVVHNTRYNGESGAQQTWLKQIAYDTNYNVYYRDRVNTGDWTAWKTVALTSDIPSVVQATDSTAGIGKLYTSTGYSVDGSMTRSAITNALNSHTQDANTIRYVNGASSSGTIYPVYEGITGTIKNIFRFLPADCVTIEYSRDGGATWTKYNKTYSQRLTDNYGQDSYYIGGPDATTEITTDYKLRFTFIPGDNRYGAIKFFYIFLNSPHTLTCDIDMSTIGAKDTFVSKIKDVAVSGWSGPNIINSFGTTFGGGSSQTLNGYGYRLTFNITKIFEKFKTEKSQILNIRAYADPIWHTAGLDYLSSGLDYDIDANKNITFPANVTVVGTLTGTASSAAKLSTSAGNATTPVYFKDGKPTALEYTIAKSVPADAKFTDTVYTHPSHTAKDSGLYKITVDSLGHVSAATAVAKSDITGLGIASDSIMGAATSSSAGTKGLVPAPTAGANTKFLRGDGTWQIIDTDNMLKYSAQTLTDADKTQVLTNLGINIATDSDVNSMITDTLNATNLKVPASTIVMNSATPDSTKQFEFTVDDTGTLTAHEV